MKVQNPSLSQMRTEVYAIDQGSVCRTGSSDRNELSMVSVPQGTVVMRDDRIGKIWETKIDEFEIGRFPITQYQYETLIGQKPSFLDSPLRPVDTVSWFDAVRFCNSLSRACGLSLAYNVGTDGADRIHESRGFRLPSEAEWQFACLAGGSAPTYGPLNEIAWHRENSEGRSHNVGEKTPNSWGLFDMLGNVWEWCEDLYDPIVYGPYRSFRGGGWNDGPRGCMATNRRRSHPTFAIDDLGFRVARSA